MLIGRGRFTEFKIPFGSRNLPIHHALPHWQSEREEGLVLAFFVCLPLSNCEQNVCLDAKEGEKEWGKVEGPLRTVRVSYVLSLDRNSLLQFPLLSR